MQNVIKTSLDHIKICLLIIISISFHFEIEMTEKSSFINSPNQS